MLLGVSGQQTFLATSTDMAQHGDAWRHTAAYQQLKITIFKNLICRMAAILKILKPPLLYFHNRLRYRSDIFMVMHGATLYLTKS